MDRFQELLTVVEEQPLSAALIAALRIGTDIKDEEFERWVKLELLGYFGDNPAMRESTIVPEYRTISGQWYDEYGRPLVIGNAALEFVNDVRLRQGVGELEGIMASTGPTAMRLTVFADIIRKNLGVDVSIFQFHPSTIRQVVTNIRVQLLDMVASRRERICSLPANKVKQSADILQIKPSLYGISIDLKALWRRAFGGKE